MEQNLNPGPVASGSQMPPPQPKHTRVGPAAGVIIIVVLLIAAGLYFWGAKLAKEGYNNPPPFIPGDTEMMQATMPAAEDTVGLPEQSPSDDPASIQADFDRTNLDAFDAQTDAALNSI